MAIKVLSLVVVALLAGAVFFEVESAMCKCQWLYLLSIFNNYKCKQRNVPFICVAEDAIFKIITKPQNDAGFPDVRISNKKYFHWSAPSGGDRFKLICPSECRGTQGMMLLYDVNNQQSFTNISAWLKNIQKTAKDELGMMLIGYDHQEYMHKPRAREVSVEQGQQV
ncbi:Ras- protein Rab-10 [Bulinus truncatus]|nr:Ras- protein Rab-10 [Bulinus truncatus]